MSVKDGYPSVVAPDALRAWCAQWLGSEFEDILCQRRHLSAVVGSPMAVMSSSRPVHLRRVWLVAMPSTRTCPVRAFRARVRW
jgi:hypothetical protein